MLIKIIIQNKMNEWREREREQTFNINIENFLFFKQKKDFISKDEPKSFFSGFSNSIPISFKKFF